MVRRDVGGREESPPVAQLPGPPVLVGAVRYRDDVAAPELQLALFLQRATRQGTFRTKDRFRIERDEQHASVF